MESRWHCMWMDEAHMHSGAFMCKEILLTAGLSCKLMTSHGMMYMMVHSWLWQIMYTVSRPRDFTERQSGQNSKQSVVSNESCNVEMGRNIGVIGRYVALLLFQVLNAAPQTLSIINCDCHLSFVRKSACRMKKETSNSASHSSWSRWIGRGMKKSPA